jgi:hypothetical protein
MKIETKYIGFLERGTIAEIVRYDGNGNPYTVIVEVKKSPGFGGNLYRMRQLHSNNCPEKNNTDFFVDGGYNKILVRGLENNEAAKYLI